MASMRDVAQQANVSVATVSRVLNDNGYVAPETKEKIITAMKELNYMPNEMARNLYRNKTYLIGMVVPDISHPFYSSVAKYVEMELFERGYKTMLCNTIKKSNREKEFLQMIQRQMMDGIIMGAHTLEVEEYQQIKKPIITLDRIIDENIPNICADHKMGGRLAAEKLLSNGCRKVIQIMGAKNVSTPSHQRHIVFGDVMKEHGVKVHTVELAWNQFDFDSYLEVANSILKEHPDVDGIFASDMVALACVKAVLKSGRRIPDDVRIVGYDGTFLVECSTPSLTTIVQPIPQLAKLAVSTILELINGSLITTQPRPLEVVLREGDTTFP